MCLKLFRVSIIMWKALLITTLQISIVIAIKSNIFTNDEKCLQHLTKDLNLMPSLKGANYQIYFSETVYYVIQVKSDDYMKTINYLQRESYWNSRGRFLLIFDEYIANLTDAFQSMAKMYVYNVIVYYDGNFFTYFPYKFRDVNVPSLDTHLISKCDDNHHTIGNLYAEKLPIIWSNTTLNVAYVYVRLYTMCVDCFARGIEFEILDILKDRLKLEVSQIKNKKIRLTFQ